MNDNYEPREIVEAKSFFLRSDLAGLSGGKQHYDLESEFAKTKKNRQWWVGGIIAAVVVVLALGAVFATYYIRQKEASIEFDEDTFQDVDLTTILNKAKKLEKELSEIRDNIVQLTLERDTKISDIEEEAKQQLALLDKKGYAPGYLAQQQNKVYIERNEAIADVKNEYNQKITREEAKLSVLENEKKNTDSQALSQAKEQSQIINSQDKLHEVEIQKLKDRYEDEIKRLRDNYERKIDSLKKFQKQMDNGTVALYDPVFRSVKSKKLLDAETDKEKEKDFDPYFDKTKYGESRLAKDTEQINEEIEEIEDLLKMIDSIPYRNSPKKTINQLQYRIPALLTKLKTYIPTYESPKEPPVLSLEEGITKDTLYSRAIKDYVINSGADGVVIYADSQATEPSEGDDDSGYGKIEIFLQAAYAGSVEDGTTAYVYPISGDTPKAIITIHKEEGVIYGKFQSSETVSDSSFVQPFDLIFFDLLDNTP